jgi:hypothetical protein
MEGITSSSSFSFLARCCFVFGFGTARGARTPAQPSGSSSSSSSAPSPAATTIPGGTSGACGGALALANFSLMPANRCVSARRCSSATRAASSSAVCASTVGLYDVPWCGSEMAASAMASRGSTCFGA